MEHDIKCNGCRLTAVIDTKYPTITDYDYNKIRKSALIALAESCNTTWPRIHIFSHTFVLVKTGPEFYIYQSVIEYMVIK